MNWISRAFKTILLVFVCFFYANASAQPALKKQKVWFDIPPQEIRTALDTFVRETDMSLIYNIAELGSVETREVTGAYSPEKALEIMLEGTGLVFEITGAKAVAIRKEKPQEIRPEEKRVSRPEKTGRASPPSKPLAGGKASNEIMLEEVMVTAQKRAERLQEMTVSANVLSGESISNTNGFELTSLNSRVPSVQIKGSLNGPVPMAIRGISTSGTESIVGLTTGVSLMIDGVPVPSDSMGFNELDDIQRIEVIKGPQSTLGGRTASAGVINIVTRNPGDEFSGSVQAVATTDTEQRLTGFITAPIGDSVGFSVSGTGTRREYMQKNLNGGKHTASERISVRAKLSFKPDSDLTLMLTGHVSEFESTGADLVYQYLTPGAPLYPFYPYPADQPIPPVHYGIPQSEAFPGVDIDFGNVTYNSPVKNSGASIDNKDANLNVEYSLGRYTLGSITAYQKENRINVQDVPVVALYYIDTLTDGQKHFDNLQSIRTDVDSFTQEFKISSPAEDPVNMVSGIFYSDVRVNMSLVSRWEGNPSDLERDITTRSFAVYSRITWPLGDNTDLLTGLRYNFDKLRFRSIQRASNVQPPGVTYAPPVAEDAFSILVGDASLRRHLYRDWMLYVTYSRGYKPRAYNTIEILTSDAPLDDPAGHEKIDHFEFGSKGAWLDGRLVVNTAIFDTVYHNYQMQIFDTLQVSPTWVMHAAGEAETRGVELDLNAALGRDFRLNFNGAYIDAKFNNFKNANIYPTQTPEQGATDFGQDLSGKPMPDAPKFKATLGAEWSVYPGALLFDVNLGAQYSYQADATMQSNQNPETRQPAFGILNLNITAVSWSNRYSIMLFVNNVFDQFYLANAEDFFSSLYGPAANAVVGFPPRDARRYGGIRFSLNF